MLRNRLRGQPTITRLESSFTHTVGTSARFLYRHPASVARHMGGRCHGTGRRGPRHRERPRAGPDRPTSRPRQPGSREEHATSTAGAGPAGTARRRGTRPVLVSIASWDPRNQDLHSWLAGQMIVDHPSLRAPVTQGAVSGSRAAMLIAQRLIVPVLGGLDEMPEHLRGAAIAGINRTLRPGEGAVLAGRTDSYEAAVRRPGGVLAPLHGCVPAGSR